MSKHTYLPFYDGHTGYPTRMRLGTLCLDILDPHQGNEDKRFDFRFRPNKLDYLDNAEYTEMIENKKTTKTAAGKEIVDLVTTIRLDKPCAYNFEVSNDTEVGMAIINLLRGEIKTEKNMKVSLLGQVGKRVQLQNPNAFLQQEVFTQIGAKEWIQKQLEARKGLAKTPEIWMLTGVQLVTGGEVVEGFKKASSQHVGATVDAGTVTTGVPSGQKLVSADISHRSSSNTEASFSYEDQRVWAAQYMQLKFDAKKLAKTKPGDTPDVDTARKDERMMVKVKDLFDRGPKALRGDYIEPIHESFEEITGLECVGDDTNQEFDAKVYADAMDGIDWEKYDENMDEVEDDFEYLERHRILADEAE